MAIVPSTIFLGLCFMAVMLTIVGSMLPSITLRVGSFLMWFSCLIFTLFSTGLSAAVYTTLTLVFSGLFILCMISFVTGLRREKVLHSKFIEHSKRTNKIDAYEYDRER